jgi:hypothetical protein
MIQTNSPLVGAFVMLKMFSRLFSRGDFQGLKVANKKPTVDWFGLIWF